MDHCNCNSKIKLLKFIIKYKIKISIAIFIFTSLLLIASSIWLIFTTTTGAKLLLETIILVNPKNIFSNNFKIKIINIDGNLYNGLYLNLDGTLHNYPVTAELNFCINKKNYFSLIKNLNNKKTTKEFVNFIKIGNNILKFEPGPILNPTKNSNKINFKLMANQLDLFYNNISGKILITGSFNRDFSTITASVRTEKLNINNIALDPVLQHKNNQLDFIITKNTDGSGSRTIETNINLQNISHLMNFVPNITRLKGKLQGFIKFDLILDSDQITARNFKNIQTNLAFKDLSMSLPEYGIKIKPLNINFTAKKSIIFINGTGIMRNGPGEFNLKGHIDPLSTNIANSLEITGDNIECMNIPGYNLMSSLQLNLAYLLPQNALTITGKVTIPQGTIDLDKQQSTAIIKSKDIIFDQNNQAQNNFKILPNIDLKIEPKTKLLGKGLNITISGKLKVYTENDLLLGNGRISIKQGIYKLSGQEFIIESGRFIYLPGTLIADPSLDIKIFPKNKQQDQYLYIEGTLSEPIIKDSGLVNEHQAMLQLLSIGSEKIASNIKSKLHLQEFGIQEDHYISSHFKNKPFDESLLNNKYFVVGKKLNDKLNIQYLKTLNSIDNTVRLKYNFSPSWSLGTEYNTEIGPGVDIGFSLEK